MLVPALNRVQQRFGPRGLLVLLGAALLASAALITGGNQGAGEGWLAADVLVKLAGVVGLIYGGAWALRRTAVPARLAGVRTRPLRVVDSVSLGQRRSVHVLRAGSRTLVVGATPTQVSLLSELPADDSHLWDADGAAAPLSFQDVLAQVVGPTANR